VKFVEEPMEVEKWRGELVEDEDGAIIVDEWTLKAWVSSARDMCSALADLANRMP